MVQLSIMQPAINKRIKNNDIKKENKEEQKSLKCLTGIG
jgi:hypothetical protein